MDYYFYGIGLIIAGGLLTTLIPEKFKGWILSFFSGSGMIFLLIPSVKVLSGNGSILFNYTLNQPIGDVSFIIDPLSAFFIIVISIMGFLGVFYSTGYMKPYFGQKRTTASFFFLLSILISSMLLVVVVRNALLFLVMWEIMSLSSFFLVAFENEKEETFQAGINYLIAMHIGTLFIIAGFIMVSLQSGSFNFNSFKAVFEKNKEAANFIFILFFIGFGTKAGFMPLHTWLPRAHPAAPSPVSGIMSGVMIKTGIYGILRILSLIGTPSHGLSYFVIIISAVSALLGVIYAIAQHDIKRLLAYHSVENIGIIGIGIGTGMLGLSYGNTLMAFLGFGGGLLHILNHSIFKELLFFGAGSVYMKTHTRNIEELGGLIKKMPYTAVFFIIGSIAICGLPPFNGFISEFLIYAGMFSGLKTGGAAVFTVLALTIASLAFIGAMALLCFTKVSGTVFLGLPRSPRTENAGEVEITILIPMALLSLFCLIIGIFPQYIFNLVEKPAFALAQMEQPLFFSHEIIPLLGRISAGCMIFLLIFIIITVLRQLLLAGKSVKSYKTWDCGYQAGNSRMQYTSSSFAQPFLALVKPLANIKKSIKKPAGLFPVSSDFESGSHDWVSQNIVRPTVKGISKFLDLFSWIQSGNTQQYILYGLIFLILTILWTVGSGK